MTTLAPQVDTELVEWIREEQVHLWSELAYAIRHAANGRWSIGASNVARRIISAARLVGPSPYGELPWELVAGGVYEAVLRVGGLEPTLPKDEEEWVHLDKVMAEHGGTRATAGPRFAGTVAAINSARERAWINGEDD